MAPERPDDAPARDALEAEARELAARGEPFVRATVVRREPPVSANVGDRGLVTADGEIRGWIGGVECAQTAVADEAREALASGEPRFLGLAPDPADIDRPGLVAKPMTCHGGGTLEVFLEPVVPASELLLVGTTAVADAVGRFAEALGFAVTVVDPAGGEPGHAAAVVGTDDPGAIADAFDAPPFTVVASMGEVDAAGMAAAVELESPYIGLVANERRAATVLERAAGLLGVDTDELREVVTVPAGVDIAARTPAEIGVSIAAELVRVRREDDDAIGADLAVDALADAPETATDPVCGMSVHVDAPATTVEHDGETYHFCSAGCAEAFEADPAEHLADA